MYKLIVFFLLLSFGVCAQEYTDSVLIVPHEDIFTVLENNSDAGGEVRIQSDPAIGNLLEWQWRQNEGQKAFSGYRIQIYSTSSYGCDIEKLKEIRNHFEETFQDIPAYLKYFDPDFKIRVGNYKSRLECIPDLHRIRKVYPSSYPVKTEISLEELKRIPMQDILPEEEEETEAMVPGK